MDQTNVNEVKPTNISLIKKAGLRIRKKFNWFKNKFSSKKSKFVLFILFLTILASIIGSILYLKSRSEKSDGKDIKTEQQNFGDSITPASMPVDETYLDKIQGKDDGRTYTEQFEYIFLNTDGEIVASNKEGTNRIYITQTSGRVVDFIISKDRKKIAYTVGAGDYSGYIQSDNVEKVVKYYKEVTNQMIPVAVFELNLETKMNKLIFETEKLKVNTFGDINGRYVPESYMKLYGYPNPSYPKSYPQADKQNFQVQAELNKQIMRLYDYNDDGSKILYYQKEIKILDLANQEIVTAEIKDGKDLKFTGDTINTFCNPYIGKWTGDLLEIEYGCYEGGFSRVFQAQDNKYSQILIDRNLFIYTGGSYPIGIKNGKVFILNSTELGQDSKSTIDVYNSITNENSLLKNIEESNYWCKYSILTQDQSNFYSVCSREGSLVVYKLDGETLEETALKNLDYPKEIFSQGLDFSPETNTLIFRESAQYNDEINKITINDSNIFLVDGEYNEYKIKATRIYNYQRGHYFKISLI